jgi:hypothetical protein
MNKEETHGPGKDDNLVGKKKKETDDLRTPVDGDYLYTTKLDRWI